MRNLRVVAFTNHPFDLANYTLLKGVNCKKFAILLLQDPNGKLVIRQLNFKEDSVTDVPVNIPLPPIISDFEYVELKNLLLFATASSVFIVNLAESTIESIELPGSEAVAAAWNHEQDSLVVAYENSKVAVYYVDYSSQQLVVLAEDSPDNKADLNVYLGWGSAETQFRGKIKGKEADLGHRPPESAYKDADKRGSICWQHGERTFAVNCLNNEGERIIRVFDQECRLQYSFGGVKVPGLCSCTVFRANRGTLATICKNDTEMLTWVVMHERNGEFQAVIRPFGNSMIETLAFSPCGARFGMGSRDATTYFIDIYMQSNFRWSQKQRFTFPNVVTVDFRLRSTPSEVVSLEIVTAQGVFVYDLAECVSRQDDRVYVIRANEIYEYDYHREILPPCGEMDPIISCDTPVNSIDCGTQSLFVRDANKMVHVYEKRDDIWQKISEELKEPEWIAIDASTKSRLEFDNSVTCELKFNGRVLINDVEIARNVTSICDYFGEALMLSQATCDNPMDVVLCLKKETLKRRDVIAGTLHEFYSRMIEKGGVLIAPEEHSGGVIVQMPRGNVELVAMRPILLQRLLRCLQTSSEDALPAWNIIRQYFPSEWDILHDIAPSLFQANISNILAVLSPDNVVSFLRKLRNVSVLQSTDYLFIERHEITNKRTSICDAIIRHYRDDNQLAAVKIVAIASLVKNNFESREALKYIAGGWLPASWLMAIVKLLKIHTDCMENYKIALALHDVELAGMCAEVAGMDPQLYRPLLKECEDSNEARRKFLMSNAAGEHVQAARYLLITCRENNAQMDDFLSYVTDHGVEEQLHGMLLPSDGDALAKVTDALVTKHLSGSKFKEAACVLCAAGEFNRALIMLKRGGLWREAISVLKDIEGPPDMYEALALSCHDRGDYLMAGEIYLRYCQDVDKAMDEWLTGRCIREIANILKTNSQRDRREKYIELFKDILQQDYISSTSIALDSGNLSREYVKRLCIVREERAVRVMQTMHEGDDAYSEGGSTISTRSHTSYASASTHTRRMRKKEKKVQSLRPGSKYEDIALLRALHKQLSLLVSTRNALRANVDLYREYLNGINNIHEGIEKLDVVVEEFRQIAATIWIEAYLQTDALLISDYVTENLVHLEPIYRSPPEILLTVN